MQVTSERGRNHIAPLSGGDRASINSPVGYFSEVARVQGKGWVYKKSIKQ